MWRNERHHLISLPKKRPTKPKRSRAKASRPKRLIPDADAQRHRVFCRVAGRRATAGTQPAGERAKDKREAQAVQAKKPREAARAKSVGARTSARSRFRTSVRERFIQIGNSFYFPGRCRGVYRPRQSGNDALGKRGRHPEHGGHRARARGERRDSRRHGSLQEGSLVRGAPRRARGRGLQTHGA